MDIEPKPLYSKQSGRKFFVRPPIGPQYRDNVDTLKFQLTTIELYKPNWNGERKDLRRAISYAHLRDVTPPVLLFGVTSEGNSICLTVTGFRPYVWIQVPEHWDDSHFDQFLEIIVNPKHRNRVYFFLEKDKWTPSYGFHNGEKYPYLRIEFETDDIRKEVVRQLWQPQSDGSLGIVEQIFIPLEYQVPWELQFFEGRSLETSGWCEIAAKRYELQSPFNLSTTCQINVTTDYQTLNAVEEITIAPLLVSSFDIECYRLANDNRFPDPLVDPVIQIATVTRVYGQTQPYAYSSVFCLDTVPDSTEFEIQSFRREVDLLNGWAQMFRNLDTDVLTGYNIFQFDLNYLMVRAITVGALEMFQLGKALGVESKIEDAGINSKAYASNKWKIVPMPGIVLIDMLPIIKRSEKLSDYKLNTVATFFLGQQKEDVHYTEIQAFHTRDAEHRGKVAHYCWWDSVLPLDIMFHNKVRSIESLVEMSRITKVPLDYLILRGQSIKVLSQVQRKCHQRGFLFAEPDNHKFNKDERRRKDREDDEYYQKAKEYGMRVRKPKPEKAYSGASVLKPDQGFYNRPVPTLDFASLYPSILIGHNLCYVTLVTKERFLNLPGVEYEVNDVLNVKTGTSRRHVFVKSTCLKGILPDILEELLRKRGEAKKKMAEAVDPALKSLYNFRQLNLKISANSIYGYTGALEASCPEIAIAETVTHWGRDMLGKTQGWLKDHYPKAKVIYGDSVVGNTPLLLRNPAGQICFRTIEELFIDGYDFDGKEFCDTTFEVWSDQGFTPIRKVIRHRTAKQLYRVSTATGIVIVTEDHSLLDSDAQVLKVEDIKPETVLLHSRHPSLEGTIEVDLKFASAFGLSLSSREIPDQVWTWNNDCRLFFLRGYLKGLQRGGLGNDLAAAGLFFLMRSLGFDINCAYSAGSYELNHSVEHTGCIVSIEPLEEAAIYVYDLETTNHHFSAGVGELVVHNTDSVMIDFRMEGEAAFKELFTLAPQIAAEISKLFPKPCKLEFEKIYYPMMLTDTKKVYTGVLWTKPDKFDYLDAKGFKHVKRDTCKLVARTAKELNRILMIERDVAKSIHYLLGVLQQIHEDVLPLKDYIITVMLSKDMDLYTASIQAHVELARRMRTRDPNNAPHSGDRIPFVAIDIDDPNIVRKLSERIEDPDWAVKHGMKIDRHWYIRVQLQEPCIKLLKQVLANPMEIFDRAAAKQRRFQSGIQELSLVSAKAPPPVVVEPTGPPPLPPWLKLFVPASDVEKKEVQKDILSAFGLSGARKNVAQVPKSTYRPALSKQQSLNSFLAKKK